MSRLLDALFTTEPLQRARLIQAFLAVELAVAGVAAVHYFAWAGVAPVGPTMLGAWTLVSMLGMSGAFVAIRAGWTLRRDDPALTVPLMAFAIACAAWAYALLGPARGAVFPTVMVTLMFGMFVGSPRSIAWLGVYSAAMLGGVMALMATLEPAYYPPRVELGHFMVVATMMPAVAILAARLARVRERSALHRAELTAALARIRELATRDELTGLVNRRHLTELMAQEHQRCIRSGHTFCIAAFQIDDFQALTAHAELRTGSNADRVLRDVAQEAQRYVRVADVLGAWDGPRFVLLMSDTRASLARGAIERLRERVAQARVAGGLRATLSAGLAEHHAGETVADTLARAEAALAECQSRATAA